MLPKLRGFNAVSELRLYRAVSEARELIGSGVFWETAVRLAATTHGADAVRVAWCVASALFARKAAADRLAGDD